ncbi:MAG: hypothetical protein HY710_07405 [Candidatus Latescibacteria bacterium]|nr:hypothetical protein [Candidatus Latescibacterota bacterium]
MSTLTGEFRLLFWAILGVIVPFGLLLCLLPGQTAVYWAWVIPHPRSALLIGAAYAGAIAYYVLALRMNDWRQVESGMGGLVLFCLVLLFATLMHWEAFRPYHVTTLVWLMFYYVGPFLVPILSRLQQSRAGVLNFEGTPDLSSAWRLWLIARGFLYLTVALAGLVFTTRLTAAWPWPIDALELRVFMGQPAIIGWNAVVVVRDGVTWRRYRLGLVLTGAIGLVQLIGLVINSTPYDWSRPLGVLLPVVFAEWCLTSLILHLRYRS